MKRRRLNTTLLLTTLLLSTSPSLALAADATNAALLARIEAMEKELALLKRQAEVKEEVAKAKEEKAATVEVGKKGLAITSPDKQFSVSLKGYAQVDGRFFLNDDANSNRSEFLARRIRPILEATAYKDFSLRLMPDFAGSSTRIYDAHVDYRYSDPLKIRVGKFKPPVGLERLQSASDIAFTERGHPTNLAPNRDFGVQLYGELIPETFEYQVGIFNGTPDLGNLDNDDDDKKDVVARVFAHPFRQSDMLALQGLGIGIAGSYGEREGNATKPILGDYRTPGQQAFFRYLSGTAATDNTYANGTHWRLYPQAYWYYNNFGLLGEYAISNQDVTRAAFSDTLQQRAWQLQANYVLTGEDVNFKGSVKPESAFNPLNGNWGALELVGRVGETDIDNNAFPLFADITRSASKAQSFGTGLNWFLNDNVNLALDYDFTRFKGGAAGGAARPDEHAILSRAQYRF